MTAALIGLYVGGSENASQSMFCVGLSIALTICARRASHLDGLRTLSRGSQSHPCHRLPAAQVITFEAAEPEQARELAIAGPRAS